MLNKVELIGYLGQEPELRVTKDGKDIYTLSVATSFSRKQQDGSYKDFTEWHKITVFHQTNFMQYLHKGDLVYLQGHLHYTQDEQNGVKRYFTQIICDEIKKLNRSTQEQDNEKLPQSSETPQNGYEYDDPNIPF